MVIAPHARFAAGDVASWWDVIPSFGAMVDAVKQEAFVLWGFAQVRRVEQMEATVRPAPI